MIRVFAISSPIGWWTVTTDDTCVLSVDFIGKTLPPDSRTEPETKLEQRLECMLSRYFKGDPVDFSPVPIAIPDKPPMVGKVMQAIHRLPYGEVQSYQWVAEQLGNANACRAVGGALGNNPIPIIVPCHRIIAKNQRLGGFMRSAPGALDIKEFLLNLEGHRFTHGKHMSSR